MKYGGIADEKIQNNLWNCIDFMLSCDDWARELPLASNKTQAKSLDSLKIVENDARTNAADASSTMDIKRFQMISKLMGSYFSDIFLP